MQPNSLAALLTTDIPDPTDFHSPSLRQLDSALRCTICSEWFDAPVTLACGHSFCSLCARNYINDKSECPSCRKAANEGHIRVNPAMEEVVSAWKLARPLILELSKAEAEQSRRRSQASKKLKRMLKRSRTQELQSSDGDIEGIAGPSITTKTRKSRSSRPPSLSMRGRGSGDDDRMHEEANGDDEEDVYEEDGQLIIPTSDSREEELDNDADDNDKPSSSDGFVSCPLCSRRVKLETINVHIDNGCRLNPLVPNGKEDGKEKKSSVDVKGQWSKIMGGGGSAKTKAKGKAGETSDDQTDLHPLPKASYAVLKDRQLKDMLLEHQLPTNGDRSGWITRHTRWVMTYNANLDKSSAQRKSLAELRAELKRWEELQKVGAKKRERERESGEVVGEDVVRYQKANKKEFARLIEAARGTSSAKGKGKNKGESSPSPNKAQTKPKSKVPSSSASASASELGPHSSVMDGALNSKRKGMSDGDDDFIIIDSEEEREIVCVS